MKNISLRIPSRKTLSVDFYQIRRDTRIQAASQDLITTKLNIETEIVNILGV